MSRLSTSSEMVSAPTLQQSGRASQFDDQPDQEGVRWERIRRVQRDLSLGLYDDPVILNAYVELSLDQIMADVLTTDTTRTPPARQASGHLRPAPSLKLGAPLQ